MTMSIDPRKYLQIEAALQDRLLKAWRPIARKLYKRMYALVKDEKFDEALRLAGEIDLGPVAVKNREYIKAVLWKAMQFGASMAAGTEKTAVSVGKYTKTLNMVADGFIASFVHNATLQTYRSAVQSIATARATAESVQKAETAPRFLKEFTSFQGEGEDMVQTIASLHTSRLAVWGFTAEAEVRGMQKYKLSAVIDSRTSDFCRWINGKEFDVEVAREKVIQALSVQNPDDLKTIAPWPKQTKAAMSSYAEMSADQLQKLGYSVPPFHPGCRTLCVPVGYSETVEGLVVSDTAPDQHNRATVDSFKELGITVTQKQVDYWNQLFDIYPADMLAALNGQPPLQVLADRKGNGIKITPQGNVSFRGRVVIGKGTAETNLVFDPLQKKMYLNYAEYRDVSAEEAAKHAKALYATAIAESKKAGAKKMEVKAGGEEGAFAHAEMGFVAEQSEWEDFRLECAGEVEEKFEEWNLTPAQKDVVLTILKSNDPEAMWAIAGLDTVVDGKPLGQLLLEGKEFTETLDFYDAKSMAKLAWYLE